MISNTHALQAGPVGVLHSWQCRISGSKAQSQKCAEVGFRKRKAALALCIWLIVFMVPHPVCGNHLQLCGSLNASVLQIKQCERVSHQSTFPASGYFRYSTPSPRAYSESHHFSIAPLCTRKDGAFGTLSSVGSGSF